MNNKDDGKLITITEFWDSVLDNGIICTSIKEAYEFCIASHNLGYTWFNGVSYLAESQYEQHGQTIVYTNNNFYFLCDDQELTLKDAEDHKFINYWFSEIDFDITKKGTPTDKMTIKQFWDSERQLGCVCRNSDEASTFARESSRLYKYNSWRNYDYYLEIGKKEAIFTNGGTFFTNVKITDDLKSYNTYNLVDFKDIDFKGVELK